MMQALLVIIVYLYFIYLYRQLLRAIHACVSAFLLNGVKILASRV